MKKILNTIALITLIAINGAVNIVEFNGVSAAAVSGMFPVFFVPAGYIFSIWGLIYFLLGVFVLYQWIGIESDDERYSFLTPIFILSSIVSAAWIFFWHFGIISGSLVMMIVLFMSLLAMYYYLRIYTKASAHPIEKWTLMLPMSVYLGWISITTIANASVYLFSIGWSSELVFPEQWVAIIVILVGLLGISLGVRFKDVAYNLVLIWVIIGIMLKFPYGSVVTGTSALVLCALLLVIVWIIIVRKRH